MQIKDKDVRRAGLSPSLEQLQILAVIDGFSLTADDLSRFWSWHLQREWYGDEEDSSSDMEMMSSDDNAFQGDYASKGSNIGTNEILLESLYCNYNNYLSPFLNNES